MTLAERRFALENYIWCVLEPVEAVFGIPALYEDRDDVNSRSRRMALAMSSKTLKRPT